MLDLGSGSGEMLCTWARDHGVIGTGIDMSRLFTEQRNSVLKNLASLIKSSSSMAMLRATSLTRRSVWQPVSVPLGSLGESLALSSLARSLRTGGIILIGEPYWRQLPPTEDVAKGCLANSISDFLTLPELLASFGHIGYDVV